MAGEANAIKVGLEILAKGGNAIDAAIAAAFAASVTSPSNCGVGGYGGHAVIALAGGRKITAIDFNTAAPASARPDMFPLDGRGNVAGNVNAFGWRAAGVPGVLAGLELALQRYGTRSLRDILTPAIELCESGRFFSAVEVLGDRPRPAPATASPDAPLPREQQRNRALARLLNTLATRNTTESFYRGDLAATVADAFQRNGGLVTRADLAAYAAREVAPLTVAWNGATLHSAPLTASGLLYLQAIHALKILDWPKLSVPERLHAKLEALRIAWADRARTWGDPEYVRVPVEGLLSAAHAAESAGKIAAALKARQPVPLQVGPSHGGGTINLCAVDGDGNLIAITLTHGNGWGARVFVPELGIVLGNGMSRFDPRPGFPNSPGPGKRPINNMCPAIVTRGGVPVLAVGGGGATRIPSGVCEVLLNFVGLGTSMRAAIAAPRLHTDGTLDVGVEEIGLRDYGPLLEKLGYKPARRGNANIGAVVFDPATRATDGLSRRGA